MPWTKKLNQKTEIWTLLLLSWLSNRKTSKLFRLSTLIHMNESWSTKKNPFKFSLLAYMNLSTFHDYKFSQFTIIAEFQIAIFALLFQQIQSCHRTFLVFTTLGEWKNSINFMFIFYEYFSSRRVFHYRQFKPKIVFSLILFFIESLRWWFIQVLWKSGFISLDTINFFHSHLISDSSGNLLSRENFHIRILLDNRKKNEI